MLHLLHQNDGSGGAVPVANTQPLQQPTAACGKRFTSSAAVQPGVLHGNRRAIFSMERARRTRPPVGTIDTANGQTSKTNNITADQYLHDHVERAS